MVTLTWHASKYKVHQLHRRYILSLISLFFKSTCLTFPTKTILLPSVGRLSLLSCLNQQGTNWVRTDQSKHTPQAFHMLVIMHTHVHMHLYPFQVSRAFAAHFKLCIYLALYSQNACVCGCLCMCVCAHTCVHVELHACMCACMCMCLE